MVLIMVAVSKKYVKKDKLVETIEELLKNYERIRIEFPSNVEGYFLVKAWSRRKGA